MFGKLQMKDLLQSSLTRGPVTAQYKVLVAVAAGLDSIRCALFTKICDIGLNGVQLHG